MNLDEMTAKLKTMLPQSKFEHSLRVVETAEQLAKTYNCDIEKAKIAALLHDCAKGFDCEQALNLCCQYNIELDDITKKRHQLIHALLGVQIAKIELPKSSIEIHELPLTKAC